MKKFIELHKFFVKESRTFIGHWNPYKTRVSWFGFGETVIHGAYEFRFRDKLYYPIAYIKFMYYSFKD